MKTTFLLITALMMFVGAASAQQPATGQSCVAVSIRPFQDTDIQNYALTNNCGQTVTVLWIPPSDAPWPPAKMTLQDGETRDTSTQTNWAYKIWGCYGTLTPTDADTGGVPNFESTNVVCK